MKLLRIVLGDLGGVTYVNIDDIVEVKFSNSSSGPLCSIRLRRDPPMPLFFSSLECFEAFHKQIDELSRNAS